MEKIHPNELKKMAEAERKKKAITLYLDPKLVEDTRDFLGNRKSVSQFINDILKQVSDILKEQKKESEVKKESEKE